MAEQFKTIPEIPNSVPNAVVPDQICAQAGVTLSWAGEHKFGIHAFDSAFTKGATAANNTERRSHYFPCVDKVFDTRTTSVMFHPVARKMVSESNGYFLFAQSLSKKSRSADFQIEVLKLSRLYRSVLRSCLEGLQSESELCPSEERADYLQHILTFYNMELVWHLCEILLIDVLPGHMVLTQLISWIRFHFPHVETEARKLLSSDDSNIARDENYWLVIVDCLLQRRIENVRALLLLHPRSNTDSFQLMDQLLRTMPVFELYSGLSATEFQIRHDCWKKEAMRHQRTGIFQGQDSYLDIISKIIIGDDSVQDVVKRHCETWYQYMVASLIYGAPAAKVFDLAFHANRSITLYGGPRNINQLDWILCAIMEMDIYKMVDHALKWPDSIWFLAHFVHLLHLLDKLNVTDSHEDSTNLCEHLLLNYGGLLMSHKSLWQIGIDYLDACRADGRAHIEALLSHVPFNSNSKAMKIIHMATEREMNDVAYTVSKVQGLRSLQRGHLGSALTWAIRSQDPAFCSQLADIFLKNYVSTGHFDALDLLESLGNDMMLGERLVFLGKYCEFLRLKRTGELKEAAALLVLLLKNRVAPKYFWLQMFTDALPLLENAKPTMARADVCDLMGFMKELLENADELEVDVKDKKLVRIQTALSRSKAMALLGEGHGSPPVI